MSDTLLLDSCKRLIDRLKYDVLGLGASANYQRIDGIQSGQRAAGWLTPAVAELQHRTYQKLLDAMYDGRPRRDLRVAAELIDETGMSAPRVLEVGCGSGYYNEVFGHLCTTNVRYTGSDFSIAMIEIARSIYPEIPFVVGDASALSFRTASFDIAFNGNALMHIPDYRAAIEESARVAREWTVLHSVPVMRDAETTFLQKDAYGGETIEIIFGEDELTACFDSAGLTVVSELQSIDYRPPLHLVPESPEMLSFLCRVD